MHPVSMATAKADSTGDNGPAPIRPETWQLSGSGEKCTPPSPGPELWCLPEPVKSAHSAAAR